MYAIIATGGKQYKVSEGDVIKVEKLGVAAGEKYKFDQVLAVGGDSLTVGTPTVAGATVTASVPFQEHGDTSRNPQDVSSPFPLGYGSGGNGHRLHP